MLKKRKNCKKTCNNYKMQPIVDKIQTRIGGATVRKLHRLIAVKAR